MLCDSDAELECYQYFGQNYLYENGVCTDGAEVLVPGSGTYCIDILYRQRGQVLTLDYEGLRTTGAGSRVSGFSAHCECCHRIR